MKPVNQKKIQIKRKASALEANPEYDRTAAAFLASIHSTGDAGEVIAFTSWASATLHSATLGGVNENLFHAAMSQNLAQIQKLVDANELVKSAEAEGVEQSMQDQLDAANESLASITQAIAELEAAAADQRAAAAHAESRLQEVADKREAVQAALDGAQRGNVKDMAFQFVLDGKHPYA